jgi:hypothetical protein
MEGSRKRSDAGCAESGAAPCLWVAQAGVQRRRVCSSGGKAVPLVLRCVIAVIAIRCCLSPLAELSVQLIKRHTRPQLNPFQSAAFRVREIQHVAPDDVLRPIPNLAALVHGTILVGDAMRKAEDGATLRCDAACSQRPSDPRREERCCAALEIVVQVRQERQL